MIWTYDCWAPSLPMRQNATYVRHLVFDVAQNLQFLNDLISKKYSKWTKWLSEHSGLCPDLWAALFSIDTAIKFF